MVKTEDEVFLLSNENESKKNHEFTLNNRSRYYWLYLLSSVLLLSGSLNIFQAIWITSLSRTTHALSSYEHVETVDIPLYPKILYELAADSEAIDDVTEAIDDLIGAFDTDHGLVALPKGQSNLLPSEQFPWDASKEVYILSAYHSLHSIQYIWHWLHKLSGAIPLDTHVFHALGVLWGDVLCAADTTPLSVSHKNLINQTAIRDAGQTRQCRDWGVVEEFRVKNSACYKDLGGSREGENIIEEWAYCPEDSPYKKVVDEYFAHKED